MRCQKQYECTGRSDDVCRNMRNTDSDKPEEVIHHKQQWDQQSTLPCPSGIPE